LKVLSERDAVGFLHFKKGSSIMQVIISASYTDSFTALATHLTPLKRHFKGARAKDKIAKTETGPESQDKHLQASQASQASITTARLRIKLPPRGKMSPSR
jgi:hypothetical protein